METDIITEQSYPKNQAHLNCIGDAGPSLLYFYETRKLPIGTKLGMSHETKVTDE